MEEFKKVVMADKAGGASGDAAYLKAVQTDGQHGQLGQGKKK